MVVRAGLELVVDGEVPASRRGVSFWGHENILKLGSWLPNSENVLKTPDL